LQKVLAGDPVIELTAPPSTGVGIGWEEPDDLRWGTEGFTPVGATWATGCTWAGTCVDATWPVAVKLTGIGCMRTAGAETATAARCWADVTMAMLETSDRRTRNLRIERPREAESMPLNTLDVREPVRDTPA
jgi:hypothetical protein